MRFEKDELLGNDTLEQEAREYAEANLEAEKQRSNQLEAALLQQQQREKALQEHFEQTRMEFILQLQAKEEEKLAVQQQLEQVSKVLAAFAQHL